MTRRALAIVAVLAAVLVAAPAGATDERHAVVLLYHHVSDDTPASTSVTPERFKAHLDYLADNDFGVWPLDRLLAAVIGGAEPVPARTVAITFDDAYESVYAQAWPRLQERGWPFAVFVNTDSIDAGHSPYMRWSQLRALAEDGVIIGNHSASHDHLIARQAGESMRAWRARVSADIERARRRIGEQTGDLPRLFAYPFGEDSSALARLVGKQHDYALTQRSGALGAHTPALAVPRFPMASGFDDLERFARAVHARALPVLAARPRPPGDGVRDPLRALHLKLAAGNYAVNRLACFSASGQPLAARLEEGPPHDLAIEVGGRGSSGRNKINCTAPAADGSGAFYWYSFQWVQETVRD